MKNNTLKIYTATITIIAAVIVIVTGIILNIIPVNIDHYNVIEHYTSRQLTLCVTLFMGITIAIFGGLLYKQKLRRSMAYAAAIANFILMVYMLATIALCCEANLTSADFLVPVIVSSVVSAIALALCSVLLYVSFEKPQGQSQENPIDTNLTLRNIAILIATIVCGFMIVMSVVDCINAFSLTDMLGYFDFDAANTIVTIIILQIGLFTTVIAVATELYLNNSSRGLVITLFTMMCIISANFLLSIIVLSGIDIGIVNVLALAAAIASAILSGIYLQNTHRRKVPLAKQLQTYKNLEAQGKITKDEYKEIAIKTIDEA